MQYVPATGDSTESADERTLRAGVIPRLTRCGRATSDRGWKRQTTRCPDCGGRRVVYAGEAIADGGTLAVFWAFLYDHPGNPEVFIDATFGTWGVEGYTADHVTFGARTGAVEGASDVASSLVTGAELGSDDPRYGIKLTREQALEHPRLDEFWQVNDAILQFDEIQRLMSGLPRRRRWLRRK